MSKQDQDRDGGAPFSFPPSLPDPSDGLRDVTRDLGLLPETWSNEDLGCDPYNTSGRFDRNQGWARIRKR